MMSGGHRGRRSMALVALLVSSFTFVAHAAVQPDYEFDLRGCTDTQAIASTGSDNSISATPGGDPTCSADGMSTSYGR